MASRSWHFSQGLVQLITHTLACSTLSGNLKIAACHQSYFINSIMMLIMGIILHRGKIYGVPTAPGEILSCVPIVSRNKNYTSTNSNRDNYLYHAGGFDGTVPVQNKMSKNPNFYAKTSLKETVVKIVPAAHPCTKWKERNPGHYNSTWICHSYSLF